jgi:acetone carboxylase gamma subunit
MPKQPNFIKAHQNSWQSHKEIEASKICGCFHCLKIFPPSKINEWWDDDKTPVCPECGIDSVIGSKSGYPITTVFLTQMQYYYFRMGAD